MGEALDVQLADELLAAGFDVFKPMSVSWYNDYLKELGLATNSTSCEVGTDSGEIAACS